MSLRITGCVLFPPPPSELIGTVSGQSALQWTTSTRFRLSCISHPLAFQMSPSLSPFAMWPALPASDYYGDSVTLGLAPVRPSHVPLVLNGSSVTEASHSSPSMKSFFIALPVGGGESLNPNDPPPVALRWRRCSSECEVPPLGIGIQWSRRLARYAVYAGVRLRV